MNLFEQIEIIPPPKKNFDLHGLPFFFFSSFFSAKPQVLLVGQYSVGKTSFIRYLLGRDFPGQRIGPEPTTDRFTGTYCYSSFFFSFSFDSFLM